MALTLYRVSSRGHESAVALTLLLSLFYSCVYKLVDRCVSVVIVAERTADVGRCHSVLFTSADSETSAGHNRSDILVLILY